MKKDTEFEDSSILELISDEDVIFSSKIKNTNSLQQIYIILTVKKLYIINKERQNKSVIEIPVKEIIMIKCQQVDKIPKIPVVKYNPHPTVILEIIDTKKNTFSTKIKETSLQRFEKSLYRLKKELEKLSNKIWQIIQNNNEIIVKRSDIDENEFFKSTDGKENIANVGQSLVNSIQKTDIFTSWEKSFQEVFSDPKIQKGILYLVIGIVFVMIIVALAKYILTAIFMVLLVYFSFILLKDANLKTPKRKK